MNIAGPGESFPLGVTCDRGGVNVAVHSEAATFVELCLFDASGAETRVRLPEVTGFVHHGHVLGVRQGQKYGFRAHGPWNPGEGRRFNPSQLLIDPYARAIDGDLVWDPAVFGHVTSDPLRLSDSDSAPIRAAFGCHRF